MSVEKALLEGIHRDPDDDTPRLVYADWLEEYGEEETWNRAHFIRCQVERAMLKPESPRWRELLRAEAPLRNRYGAAWWGRLPKLSDVAYLTFDRGFVPGAHVGARFNVGINLELLFQATPIQRLILHDTGQAFLEELLRSPLVTRLTHLELALYADGDDGVLAVASCPFLGRLRSLVLDTVRRTGTSFRIGDEGANALARSPHLAKLQHLRLYPHSISSRGRDALIARFGEAALSLSAHSGKR